MSDSKTIILMTLYMSLCVVSFEIISQKFIKTKNRRIVSSDASKRTLEARSGIECSAVCTSDENCCSSSYDTHSNLCSLFSTCATEYAEGCSITKKTPEPVAPNWFFSTRLCYEWYGDADVNQCGGSGVSTNLSAYVNEWTTYYKDDTDDRYGGCQMRWGIESVGYDNWFDNVQICFRWSAVGSGNDLCGKGVGNDLCATVNTFTNYYRDDTTSYSKGCQMQWKLSVPIDSPQWIQKTKFCYEWYTNDNQGQCGGVSNGDSCAIANSFTAPYIDHTAGVGGGCYMRWKIFVDT